MSVSLPEMATPGAVRAELALWVSQGLEITQQHPLRGKHQSTGVLRAANSTS